MQVATLLLQEIPHYREAFLDRLHARLHSAGIELRVLYGAGGPRASSSDGLVKRSWAQAVPTVSRRWLTMDLVWQSCWPQLKGSDLIVVEQSNRLLINYVLQLRRLWTEQTQLGYWGHGRNLQSRNPHGLRERWKRSWLCAVDWWFAYTEMTAEYVRSQGFDTERITVVNNATDDKAMRVGLEECYAMSRMAARESLGLGNGPVALYCGALALNKRLEFLLAAAEKIRAAIPSFELIVVGDGPDRVRIEAASKEWPWLHYVGAAFGSERAKYWYVADVSLMPGPVGLVIVDSFIAECPLITVADPAHGPEIAYLQSERNGLMTGKSLDAYVNGVASVLGDSPRLQMLRQGCKESARNYTLDAMVENFANGIISSLSESPRKVDKQADIRQTS